MNQQTTQAKNPTSAPPETGDTVGNTLHGMLDTTVELLSALGRATSAGVEELTNCMLIQVNTETRARIDQLVTAGVVKNRHQGAELLIKAGAETQASLFKHVEETEKEIHALHQQLRSLVTIKVNQ